ncbi:MAG: hypothetical protein AAF296_08090 [Pseudomonadota bacterium]
MPEYDLPKDQTPISPLEYWMESMSVWQDFGREASKLWVERMSATPAAISQETAPAEDTMATNLMRMMADFNLRHWENTARLLSGLPAWMRVPNMTAGSAMVDWFDKVQRANTDVYGSLGNFIPSIDPDQLQELVRRPLGLMTPEGTPDDLTRIKGIGPKLSAKLNELGIYHFRQIAKWGQEEAAWIDDYLSFKGRVGREKWIPQAKGFSANGSGSLH